MAGALVIDEVTKRFGSLVAVDRLSLELDEGQLFGIAGPNGAGKTTLFNIISGIPSGPDDGRIVYRGRAIHGLPGHVICRQGVVRTFQKEAAFDTLTVIENVRIGAVYGSGRSTITTADLVSSMMVDFELEGYADEPAGRLPLFVKKRLMLASAMATEPTLVLLDEPASGLNKVEIEQMEVLIRRMHASGATILLIEHVLPLLMAVSDRVMIMNQGRRLVVGTPDEVVADPRVVEAYLGDRWRRDAQN
jgi:branched-chain amino acid transport system ATP-binding protein